MLSAMGSIHGSSTVRWNPKDLIFSLIVQPQGDIMSRHILPESIVTIAADQYQQTLLSFCKLLKFLIRRWFSSHLTLYSHRLQGFPHRIPANRSETAVWIVMDTSCAYSYICSGVHFVAAWTCTIYISHTAQATAKLAELLPACLFIAPGTGPLFFLFIGFRSPEDRKIRHPPVLLFLPLQAFLL